VPGPSGDEARRVELAYRSDGRFGLQGRLTPGGGLIRLTYSTDGATHNTRLRLGRNQPLLGQLDVVEPMAERGDCLVGVWEANSLRVAQRVSVTRGPTTQIADTLRVDYLLWNRWQRRRNNLGLRVMLDTLIGDNDGVPFLVPGRQGILHHSAEYTGRVPPWIQAIQRGDPLDPGAVVHLTLRGADATPPDRLVVDHWPGSDAPYEFFRGPQLTWGHDSAVGLYWDPISLGAGEARRFTFFYGLGGMSSLETGNTTLSLTVPKRVAAGETFFLAGRVFGVQGGSAATLDLPPGFKSSDPLEQDVEIDDKASFAFVGWELQAPKRTGEVSLCVRVGSAQESVRLTVT
jgi:hypothetical protein